MALTIRTMQPSDSSLWDIYVNAHPKATLYHLSGWKNVIERTYGHKTYYLIAVQDNQPGLTNSSNPRNQHDPDYELSSTDCQLNTVGILPLVHLKHFIFGNGLISMPFFDLGGILADDEEVEKALLLEAIKLGKKLKAKSIELRHIEPLAWLADSSKLIADSQKEDSTSHNPSAKSFDTMPYDLSAMNCVLRTRSHKVRMLLDLPGSSEKLLKSFKSKLRNQIRKPVRDGLKAEIGGVGLMDEFYQVFSVNMRDLGSPVHSKRLMRNVLEEFPKRSRIIVVRKDEKILASSLVVGLKETLENPWASALREYSSLSPNMLLYWTMLEYACEKGYAFFDFGRSSPDEGTYRFKDQWGAKPTPLYWHYISLNGRLAGEATSEKTKFEKAIQYWQKLPVPITRVVGPGIRKYIGL